MNSSITMPALSPTMEKGTIAKWLVAAGETVRLGTPIAEVETDKATMEVEADQEGVLLAILIPEGSEDVPVGTPIAVIGEAGAAMDAPAPAPVATPVAVTAPAAPVATPPLAPNSAPAPLMIAAHDGANASTTSPLARRIAGALGIDLAGITGTGSGGRIMKRDLGLDPTVAAAPLAGAPTFVASPLELLAQTAIPHKAVRLSSMRRTIAQRLTRSKQQVPHIYLGVDVRLDALLDLRGRINEELADSETRISINDMLMKALALSLMHVPECNVSFTGDALLQFHRVDISMAVAVPNGLITPVIRGADRKSLSAIASESRRLAELARDCKLQLDDYQGGTASMSNLGAMGIGQFSAIINPPQAMIMAVGVAEKKAVVTGDAIGVATVMTATGSFDHRAVDGADAARLMNAFRALVENPIRILS